MYVKGQHTVHAARAEVWATLLSPAALKNCLPGCQQLVATGEDEYEAALSIGVAPARGSYTGRIKAVDKHPTSSLRLLVEGRGGLGRIKADGVIALRDAADGQTVVTFGGEVQVSGLIALAGEGLLQPAAKALIDHYFRCLEAQLPPPTG
ncbi:MAG: carbon monoxide dehydrogenase subunit G [Chloroflexi bacterium]|nr:carbon monoxide dehydrogenase subunit G [Chloroflexota bacterium]